MRLGEFRFDARRWSRADWAAAIATALLFLSLFMPWFGITLLGTSATADALDSHGYLYLVPVLSLAIVGYLVFRAGFASAQPLDVRVHERVLLGATAVNLLVVLVGFFSVPGSADVPGLITRQAGAFIGLIAALAAAAPVAAAILSNATQRQPE
jgi:hypothetical protein